MSDRIPCGTSSCESLAVCEVFWPGQPLYMCKPCAERALAVNQAMGGVDLPIRPLPESRK